MKPFEVHPYSISTLKDILAKKSGALPSVVNDKLHLVYFDNYFSHLNAATILVENHYIDRDFMEDFAGFYARCFEEYKSSCTRLHFFNCTFTSREFSNAIVKRGIRLSRDVLQQTYLGFVVVKQLPRTFIGRTCLKTYETDNSRRVYPILRNYPVGLYGIDLFVEKTLGFQEQDRGAAACATSALWTLFQGTGKLFQHSIPSQVEITKMATQIPDEDVPGILPSRGLTGRQEIYAIRQMGLEADHTNAQDEFNMLGSIYAYLSAGIPLLLRISLFDTSYGTVAKFVDGHAVTVTGFSLGRNHILPYGNLQFNLRATRVDKIYVHDDQVGPFARMVVDSVVITGQMQGQNYDFYSLSTSWRGKDKIIGSIRAVPRFHVIPLYPKIRIRFEFIRDVVMGFDIFLREAIFGPIPIQSLPSPFEWDIFLTTVNDFKSDIRKDNTLTDKVKRLILLKNMPRYLWRVKLLHNDVEHLELLFDATDIEQGNFFVLAVEKNEVSYNFLKSVSKLQQTNPFYQAKPYWGILKWFSKLN